MARATQRLTVRVSFPVRVAVLADGGIERAETEAVLREVETEVVVEVPRDLSPEERDSAAQDAVIAAISSAVSGLDGFGTPGML